MSTRAKPTSSWFSIYSGQLCIGHVLSRGPKGFESFDTNDKSLGTFSTMKLAADACSGCAILCTAEVLS
jgi:hypothetical protein